MTATATRTTYKRLGIIFDFDDTLAPDSFRSLLESYGMDKASFEAEHVQPLISDGWDAILAKMYCLIRKSQRRSDVNITKQHLRAVGRAIQFFDGVPEMFDRLRRCAAQIVPDIEVEFYLLTSGLVEIVRGTPITDQFIGIWGCEFHYNEHDQITFVKKIITHAEKVRYVLQISKGVSERGEPGRPTDVYRDVPEDKFHIPLRQIIYVGDGASDMPVFGLLNQHRGIAIGIYKGDSPEDWRNYEAMNQGRRLVNLAPANYREESELMRSLTLALESICKQIALDELGIGE